MTQGSGPSVSAYMHRQLEIVPENAAAFDAAVRMRDRRVGCVFVESLNREARDCRIGGIITETDVIGKVLAQGRDPEVVTAGQIMSRPLLTIAPDRPMIDAGHLMERHHVRHLGVSDGDEIVGVISVRDLARHFFEAPSGPVEALNDVYRPLGVLMQKQLETIDAGAPAAAAATRMAERRIGSLFVVEAGEIVGIVTETDLVRKAVAGGPDPGSQRVGALLSSPLLDIDLNRSVRDACDVMAKHQVRHLTVRDQSAVVGVISLRDLVRMITARDRPDFLRRTAEERTERRL